MSSQTEKSPGETRSKLSKGTMRVGTIDELVACHPATLRGLFADAPPLDPTEIGEQPRGRLLALEPLASLHVASRPLVRWFARSPLWHGVGFDHGGNAGYNRVLGGTAARFRAAVEPSELDGRPALVLHYDRNPWPVRAFRDEVRRLDARIALGAFFLQSGDRTRLLGWFGLEA